MVLGPPAASRPPGPPRLSARSRPDAVIPAFEIGREPSAAADDPKTVALRAKVHSLAARCDLLGPLGQPVADVWIDGAPPAGTADAVASLRAGVRRRAAATIDPDRMATSLEWFADFLAFVRRVPFVALSHAGDIDSSIYNAETLDMFGEYIRQRGSRQRGRVGSAIASDTVDSYVSAIKTLRGVETHYAVVIPSTDLLRPRASKQARRIQGPPGERQLKRGIRASHLRRLAAMGYDRSSSRGMLEWAAALVAWNLLLRGAELGVVPGKAFDPRRDATFSAIEWRAPCSDSAWLPWLTWDVVPVKDTSARRRVCPMAVRRRGSGPVGGDPLCVYDAIARAWELAAGSPPPAEGRTRDPRLAARPFFVGRRGGAWDTNDTRDLARRLASALGLAPAEFGGKSFRIGGATDWRDVFGADAERIISQRGRWHSDIARLYQRALAETHLRGSALAGDAAHADLESLCRGWAQPATFR